MPDTDLKIVDIDPFTRVKSRFDPFTVLDEAKERLEERCRLQAQGYDLEKVTIRVSSELGIAPDQVWSAGKHQVTVKARNLLTIVLLGCEKAGFQYHRIIQKTWCLAAICKYFGKAW